MDGGFREFFKIPPGTKPPIQQQTKLKAHKKNATKAEGEDSDAADKGIVKDDEGLKEALTALVVEDGEGDVVMAGTPETEEKPGKKKKQSPAKEKKDTGGQ